MTVRVRYAPSPTGHLHVGSLRTALYNYLFARHTNGVYLVRIEDTDLERSRPEFTTSILESLRWASLEADQVPIVQSDRKKEHLAVAQKLLDEGRAYRCYCTPDELRDRIGTTAHEGGYMLYDRYCRDADALDKPYAIRFKVPDEVDHIAFDDLIRGTIRFERDQFDDFIIVRTDGTPMYNFVVVVDDAAMKITHVLRGEDHISNTPKQILLYKACNYAIPAFAHFSLILGPDGQRLSKRHMATSVAEFKKEGYLADALCNYLVRLGWSHGDQEIFTREELIQYFDLSSMNKSGASFDIQKLAWMNGVYIRELSAEEIITLCERDVEPELRNLLPNWSSASLCSFIDLYKERAKTLKELCDDLRSVHERPRVFPDEINGATLENLDAVCKMLSGLEDHSFEAINDALKVLSKQRGIPLKDIGQPLRIALTGKTSSPGFARLIALLSIDESIERIGYYMKHIKRSMER